MRRGCFALLRCVHGGPWDRQQRRSGRRSWRRGRRADFRPGGITKAPDGFTPDLARFAVQGTLLPEASIELADADAAPGNVLLTVALENVLVTRVAIAVDQDGHPVESVELDYQQITLTAGAATFCWDRVLQRRCS